MTPEAKRYDRNCILAMTAGQLLVAQALGKAVKGIVVGKTRYSVGNVAYDVRFAEPLDEGPNSALIAMAAHAALAHASGAPFEMRVKGLTMEQVIQLQRAEAILLPSIVDGSFKRVVQALDDLKAPGLREFE